MKKHKIAIISILLSISAFTQEYMPLAVDQGHWFVALKDKESPLPYDELWHYYSHEDTLIEGVEFKKVYMQLADTFSTQNPPFEPFGPINLVALIRDDAENKIVYAISYQDPFYSDCPQNEEYVLYDFAQEVGDTVYSCLFDWFYESKEITAIESLTKFGIDTRVFSVGYGNDHFYEGIGSYYGLLEGFFDPLDDKKDIYITYLYDYCRSDDCDVIVNTGEKQIKNKAISVSPNPAGEYFQIRFLHQTKNKVKTIECYNLLGEKTAVIRIIKNKDIKVNTQTWPKGLYIIRITSNDNFTNSIKVFIN